jgi:SPP1 family phage portal protein
MIFDFIKSAIVGKTETQSTKEMRWLETKISFWLTCPQRIAQIAAIQYYRGFHDILSKTREIVGKDGVLEVVDNLPNNIIIDNQYKKMVDLKKNYLFGKPVSINGKDTSKIEKVQKILNKSFQRTLGKQGLQAIQAGISWLYITYDDNGNLKFVSLNASEIMPIWKDSEHTELQMAVHFYLQEREYATSVIDYDEKVEVFKPDGIYYFVRKAGSLIPETIPFRPYFTMETEDPQTKAPANIDMKWNKIPLVAFKSNSSEIALIECCKSLQDALNEILSTFKDNLDEDVRKTILILDNYDGTDLGEFRKNLAQYGAIKVRSADGAKGDVRKLSIEVDATNYELVVKLLKKAIVDNCKGYDVKDDSVGGNANQMHISAMFNDCDIDANETETEFQASLEQVMYFVSSHLSNSAQINIDEEPINFIFNRDLLMSETEILDSLVGAGVKISQKTLLSQVPFIDDVDQEIIQVKEDEKGELDKYGDQFTNSNQDQNQDDSTKA